MVASWTARGGGGGIALAVGEDAGGCHGAARALAQSRRSQRERAHLPTPSAPEARAVTRRSWPETPLTLGGAARLTSCAHHPEYRQHGAPVYSGFQLCASSARSAGVSPANKPPRKAAKMAAPLGLTHVKTAVIPWRRVPRAEEHQGSRTRGGVARC